ncbi:MAG: NAD(P)(+) transhydrogenase (Re/Si-specific) subunit beta [Thermoplasmatales archaeon]|nr:NAD(P)(+) transhydrogenase (Re/Si-specific) subunit beta [Thermoplasmatales archaeon]
MSNPYIGDLIDAVYVLAVIFFILGLRAMSSPETARRGIVQAGMAMLAAVVVTFLTPGISNWAWIAAGVFVGGGAGFVWARRVQMTAMPQMVAVFNGMGGGAAAAIAAIELLTTLTNSADVGLSLAGAIIGSTSIAGSVIAFLKLQGWMRSKPIVFPAQQGVNVAVLAIGIGFGVTSALTANPIWLGPFFLGSLKPIEPSDAAVMMAYAGSVIIAPGYGMAVAQAQGKVKELADLLEQKGVDVKFAIHPVAGRMPGHMNVLLAEAGIAYDKLFDRDEINEQFPQTDVVLVIGANDVVNPAARRQGSALQGMPILDVDKAHNVLVIKRGQGKGFAGIENELFYKDNCHMLYGDAKDVVTKLVSALKSTPG